MSALCVSDEVGERSRAVGLSLNVESSCSMVDFSRLTAGALRGARALRGALHQRHGLRQIERRTAMAAALQRRALLLWLCP
jgi:hypothetical protein